ncbi:uncharacterized protein LOC128553026 [Mercenaria mercenaria]|uniref:uncharacterized protein LOC128553026 n=1 Tax=Mercenaria mercenaria TaxID=6596 RepID=UPI00234E530B|nr:uncharacterized protein LOC128553026 [Mercenaria mercenaria]
MYTFFFNCFAVKDGVLPQITQIAAVELQSGEQFNTYVKPTVPISMAATTVTGISFYNEEMTVNGTKVQSVSIKTAMDEFVNWISKFKSVCLVAHNGRRFDFPILVSTLKNIGAQDKLSECAFIDSMSVFRKLYPNTSLKQVDLVSSLLGETYDAHNAMGDVVALGKLIKFVNLSSNDLMAHSFTQSAIANNMAFNKSKTLNLPSLNPLIYSGVIKKPTAENIAGSGLNINHLKLLHTRGGEDALKDVFISKNSEGLPRVSNNKKVLEEIVPQIAKYFENH